MAITVNEAEKRCYTVNEILGISRPTVYELLKNIVNLIRKPRISLT